MHGVGVGRHLSDCGPWLGLSCSCFRVKEVMCGLIQQACEKIDRTRAVGICQIAGHGWDCLVRVSE